MKKSLLNGQLASAMLMSSIFALATSLSSTPARANALNECEPVFHSSDTNHTTAVEVGLVSLDSPVNKKMALERNAADLIPANLNLRAIKFENWTLPKKAKDPKFQPALGELLDMMTETHFESVDPKLTIEKGEMHLARALGEGQSVEFEYRRDSRSNSFRLDKIMIFKPNGQSFTIDKSPLSDSGLHFVRDAAILVETTELFEGRETLATLRPLESSDLGQWAEGKPAVEEILKKKKNQEPSSILRGLVGDLGSVDRERIEKIQSSAQVLKVPIIIEGDLLKEIAAWSNRMPDLPRGQVKAALKGNRINRLIWSARLSSSIKLIVSTIRKQSAKWIVLGAIIVGLQQAPGLYKHTRDILPGHSFTSSTAKQSDHFSPEQMSILTELLKRLQSGNSPNTATDVEGRAGLVGATADNVSTVQSLPIVSNLSTTISKLAADEKGLGGAMTFYMSDLNTQTNTPIKADSVQVAQSQIKSGYLIAVFAKTQKIILAPVVQSQGTTLPAIATVVIERAGHEALYDVLASSIAHR